MATYSFLNVQAAISGPGGSFSMGSGAGVAEEGITADPVEDKNTVNYGADGTPMHNLHAAKPGLITVRLLKTSPVNAQLNELYNLQTSDASLHGQNTITVSDPNRGDFITAQLSAFKKRPTVVYSKDGAMNEWTFDVGILDMDLGAGIPDVNV